jgi:hypothetical protein
VSAEESLSLSLSASERGDPVANSLVDPSPYLFPRKSLYGLTVSQVKWRATQNVFYSFKSSLSLQGLFKAQIPRAQIHHQFISINNSAMLIPV